ncbi:hypothetical protein HPP92_008389 [Vanilla planifolia]|nr:hypothetical protein HPP92_008389 [Vanilla planifolia]
MTQEGSEASVASSSPAANWWPEMNTNPMAVSWNVLTTHRWQQQHQPQFSTNVNPSNSSGEEDISMATNSFTHHSGLGITSSPSSSSAATAVIDPGENHLWNQVFLGVGSHGEGEKFLEVLSSKGLTTHMFDPACDYLKKLDSSWELTNSSSSLDTLERQLKTYTGGHMIESERVTSNLTDLISHWTIAPPNPHIDQVHIAPSTCNVSMSPNPMPYLSPHIKHELGEGSTFSLGGLTNGDQVMSDAPWAAARTTPDLNSYVSQHKPSSLRSQRWFESSKREGNMRPRHL